VEEIDRPFIARLLFGLLAGLQFLWPGFLYWLGVLAAGKGKRHSRRLPLSLAERKYPPPLFPSGRAAT